jgi:hypothetical protein
LLFCFNYISGVNHDVLPSIGVKSSKRKTHGSTSRGCANPAGEVIDKLNVLIKDDNYSVCFGEIEQSSQLHEFKFCDCPEMTEHQMQRLANLSLTAAADEDESVTELTGDDETTLQIFLTENTESLKAIDTHAAIGNAVEFMVPKQFHSLHDDDVVVYTNTGKAALTSKVRRMVFEVKSTGCENQLILQMLKRLVTSLDFSHILENSIVFGATPTMAFIFVGIRYIPINRRGDNHVSLYLFSVPHKDVIPMWQLASRVNSPIDFLTEDAALVMKGLLSYGCDPWLCRVRLLAWSQFRVYEIALPYLVDRPDSKKKRGQKTVGVSANTSLIVLKVVGEEDAFRRELAALDAVKPSFFVCGISHDGVTIKGAGDVHKFEKSTVKIFKDRKGAAVDGCGWWRSACQLAPSSGGVLLMHQGESVPEDPDHDTRTEIVNNCMEALELMHAKGYVHTDLRLPNLLKFDGIYQPIDFGEAVKTGAGVCVDQLSDARRKLVSDAAAKTKGASLYWNEHHDIEMLFRAVFYAEAVTVEEAVERPCNVIVKGKKRGPRAIDENASRPKRVCSKRRR